MTNVIAMELMKMAMLDVLQEAMVRESLSPIPVERRIVGRDGDISIDRAFIEARKFGLGAGQPVTAASVTLAARLSEGVEAMSNAEAALGGIESANTIDVAVITRSADHGVGYLSYAVILAAGVLVLFVFRHANNYLRGGLGRDYVSLTSEKGAAVAAPAEYECL